ncbi:MAG: hypothetical protein HY958_01620 [Bacteroidia bacterium]|nr:hypothetical protein [Bacteroidia bacterium]
MLFIFILPMAGIISCKKKAITDIKHNPSTPNNPVPENGATDQVLLTINWSPCTDTNGDSIKYDVYFGATNNPPLVAANISTTSYTLPVLTKTTTYYWKVIAKDPQKNESEGSLWSFTTSSFLGNGTFPDTRDNKNYKYQQIGSQVWTAENINYETAGGSWYYDNNPVNSEYGKLYDWQTAQTVCPQGWHIPSDAEWQKAIDYLGGNDVAGGKMKEAGSAHWNGTNGGGDNSSGFNAIPGGYRNNTGTFLNKGYMANYWSSTSGGDNSNSAFYRSIDNQGTDITKIFNYKTNAFSVRCVKN